jgi:DNA mismatch repair protein MutS
LQVAQLAGVPQAVIRAARKHLAELEAHSLQASPQFDLFAAPAEAVNESEPQIDARPQPEHLLTGALDDIDPDALTPRQALDALYRLKAMLEQQRA